MKQISLGFLVSLLLVFLLFSSASARLLVSNHGGKNQKLTRVDSWTDSDDLMAGVAVKGRCGEDDEECARRKMMEEAHLDYVYTEEERH